MRYNAYREAGTRSVILEKPSDVTILRVQFEVASIGEQRDCLTEACEFLKAPISHWAILACADPFMSRATGI